GRAAKRVARELLPLTVAGPASQQIRLIREFWGTRLRPLGDSPLEVRETRARAVAGEILAAIEATYAAHDDPAWTIREAAPAVRRWIEEQTFASNAAPATSVPGAVTSVPAATTSVPREGTRPRGTEVAARGTEVAPP